MSREGGFRLEFEFSFFLINDTFRPLGLAAPPHLQEHTALIPDKFFFLTSDIIECIHY